MGVICGGGLLICLVPMLTLLPVLLLRGRQNVLDHAVVGEANTRERLENIWLKRPVTVTVITAALCGLAATQASRMYFDYNLLNMQSAGLPAVEFEHKLIKTTPKSVIFRRVLVATNVPQALELEERAKTLPTVASVESMTQFLAEDQTRKLRLVDEIKVDLAGLRFLEPDRADR